MNEEILKLAKECGWSLEGIHRPIEQKLEAFYRAAYNAGLEAGAKVLDANIKQCSSSGYLREVLVSNVAAAPEYKEQV